MTRSARHVDSLRAAKNLGHAGGKERDFVRLAWGLAVGVRFLEGISVHLRGDPRGRGRGTCAIGASE